MPEMVGDLLRQSERADRSRDGRLLIQVVPPDERSCRRFTLSELTVPV